MPKGKKAKSEGNSIIDSTNNIYSKSQVSYRKMPEIHLGQKKATNCLFYIIKTVSQQECQKTKYKLLGVESMKKSLQNKNHNHKNDDYLSHKLH